MILWLYKKLSTQNRNPAIMLDFFYLLFKEKKMNEVRYMEVAQKLNLIAHAQSAGVIYWKPAGLKLYENLKSFIRQYHQENDYMEVKSPCLVAPELFEKSGHMSKYKDNMFFVNDNHYAMRPMSCPNHIVIYQSELRSYQELPLKIFEFGQVFRNESSGSLQLMFRQREFSQDDSHVFVSQENIKKVVKDYIVMSQNVYKKLGFEHVHFALSLRPDNRFGSDDQWSQAENLLRQSFIELNIAFEEIPNGGAFYGPKIEMQVKDKLNRSWQLGVIQLDYVLPKRFGLEFINSKGEKEMPIILHHAVLGSLERMIGILLESFGEKLPDFLHPYSHIILPVSEKFLDYARIVKKQMKSHQVIVDNDGSSLSKKIAKWKSLGSSHIYVVGEKEMKNFQEFGRVVAMKNNQLIEVIPLQFL